MKRSWISSAVSFISSAIVLSGCVASTEPASSDENTNGAAAEPVGEAQQHILTYGGLVGSDGLYAWNRENHSIYSFNGPNSWSPLGRVGYSYALSNGGLYGIGYNGIFAYGGSPYTWNQIGNPAIGLYGGGYGLFSLGVDGTLSAYGGSPYAWNAIGGAASSYAVNDIGLYSLGYDGSSGVFAYGGSPYTWNQIGGAANALYAYGNNLYATFADGNFYQYGGSPYAWTQIGGPYQSLAFYDGVPYGTGLDGVTYAYSGTPLSWNAIGSGYSSLYGGPFGLYGVNPSNGYFYNYCGTPNCWTSYGRP